MKVLNLYAGLGGNRKLWGGDIEVTAVEIDPKVAAVYSDFFPEDKVIVGDAHEYLLQNFKDFDFFWTSPPCPSHSQFRFMCGVKAWGQEALYPDMRLYEEIIFLKYYCADQKWVVENVVSYYDPLIRPQTCSRHYFWSNFLIPDKGGFQRLNIKASKVKDLEKIHGFDLSKYKDLGDKLKNLRNCVEPELGRYVLDCAFKLKQEVLACTN